MCSMNWPYMYGEMGNSGLAGVDADGDIAHPCGSGLTVGGRRQKCRGGYRCESVLTHFGSFKPCGAPWILQRRD